jgi:hypothetical protein
VDHAKRVGQRAGGLVSLTMPRQYGRLPGPPGERRVVCDYCGITWYRSACRRDASGFLACPDDQSGRDTATLDRLNAQAAAQVRYPRPAIERW